MSVQEIRDIYRIIMSHFGEGAEALREIGEGRTKKVLRGVNVGKRVHGANVFTLLDRSSTPDHLVPAANFEELFEEGALRVAIGEWQEFYTDLGPGWRGSSVRWRLEE